ncbi:hypothetical protein M3Y97_00653500 [Aphelenchoides bicaudatus]|nr:hypothetical protein M3Y97_00653500 [Aphelenchoides bicaudatus]
MSGRANLESEYVLYGNLHVSHWCFANLALSCACALISVAFLPGYFKAIGVIIPILLHGMLALAVHKRHLIGLYASFGLIVTLYIMGLLSMLICIGIEVVQNPPWQLQIVHSPRGHLVRSLDKCFVASHLRLEQVDLHSTQQPHQLCRRVLRSLVCLESVHIF